MMFGVNIQDPKESFIADKGSFVQELKELFSHEVKAIKKFDEKT